MSRAYDPNIAPPGSNDDEWFEREAAVAPLARKGSLNWILIASCVAVLVVGFVLGAFSGPSNEGHAEIEAMRARARSVEGTRALGGPLLLERLERLPRPAPAAAPTEAAPGEVVPTEPTPMEPATELPVAEVKPEVAPQPEATKPAGERPPPSPAETRPIKVLPTIEVKPAASKPAEAKPAEVKAAEAKPAEVKAAEVKPAEVKPAEVKPAETKPADQKAPANVVEQALTEAKALLDARKWGEAKTAYDKALGLSPGNTKALFGRGRALFEQRQLQPAMKDLEAVLAAEPKHPNALLMAGSIAQELGRKDDAKRFYQRYLEAWPEGRKAAEVKNLLERL